MGTFIKLAQEELNVFTTGFLRFFFGFLIIIPYILKTKFEVFSTKNLKIHILRSALNLPAMLLGFAALAMLPLEKMTAIHFIVPIIVTILAVIFLKEKIYLYRSIALVMGFLGMLIILRPGIIDISIGIYMALISSLIWSVVIILTKKVSKDDSAITILSHQYVYMSLFSFPLVIYFWDQPSLKTIIFILCAAMSGTILHIALNHAYKLVDVTMTQPYSFLGLVVSSIIGYFVFSDKPDFYTWLGASVIFCGVLLISYRELQLNKEITRKRLNINS
jgi:drug/metabolite transporter (DMT)-like permease|tara:strand:- start:258 stop:1085 length:828 start_codon:yes stop_codon:yes gene_type:complete